MSFEPIYRLFRYLFPPHPEVLKPNQKITLWVAFVGLVITSFLAIITLRAAFSAPFVAMTTSVALGFLSDRINRYHFENKIENDISRVTMNIRNFEYIGDGVAGANWLIKNIRNATRVINTSFNRAESLNQPRLRKMVDDFIDVMKKTLDDGRCSWIDIYTEDQEAEIEKIRVSLSPVGINHYAAIKLKTELTNVPLLEVILMEFDNTDNIAVLIGWAFKNSPQSKVYKTTDRDALLFFEDYLARLREHRAPSRALLPSTPSASSSPTPS